uniref:NADH-ubiquinone oxidoreductase chain 4L n=1 Tax=Cucujoidea sp. 35 KM-2017 TaxID=2219373 RepID=A0A346RFX8_9CUCU|nr:NADH dehydrogenase subunit 4L [Cucujoidea sp. 35 KM-2017]
MKIYYLLSLIMFFCSIISFSLKRKHLLMMLLSLEFVILSLFMILYIYLLNYSSELYFSMIFMVMSVSEGVLGLSLLVLMVRTHGNDYFSSFNLLW